MAIIIPMAGLSSRFAKAGYESPKYRLMLNGKALFAHAVESFSAYFDSHSFVFIARDIEDTTAFIESQLTAMGVRSWNLVVVPGPTEGQADSVRIGIEHGGLDLAEPVTIFNIDTFRPGYRFPPQPWFGHADGYLEVIRSTSPHFSFVLPRNERESTVERTAEKSVISDLASTGIYHFQQGARFLEAFYAGDTSMSERYVAPLYNNLIQAGADIRYDLIAPSDVVFCGTPAEYIAIGGVAAGHA